MRRLIFFALLLCFAVPLWPAENPYTPLMAYNGAWQVTRKNSPKPDTVVNQCAKVGNFFTCAQSVNGSPGSLLVFIPRPDKPGHYYTQNIRPEGQATSRGDLQIDGNNWTFFSNWNDGGHTTFYKTVNTFTSKNHITFEQLESTDDKAWTTTNSGEETRIAAH